MGRGGSDLHAPDVAETLGGVVLLGQGFPGPEEPYYDETKHIRARRRDRGEPIWRQ